MPSPHVALGVPLMDADHATLEAMFESVSSTPDARLAALLAEIETEIRAHFAREEDLMRAVGLPILHCHIAQHELLLAELRHGHAAVAIGDKLALRRFLDSKLPGLVSGHIESVDAVSASFLRGGTAATDLGCLRLPLPPAEI